MAFPAYVKLGWKDSGEQPKPVVARTDMERGIAKQRRIAADTVVTMEITAYFDTALEASDFEDWIYLDIGGGADWFDFTHPRTGAVVLARIVGGDIGKLVPSNRTWSMTMRQFKIEYVRVAL